MTPTRPTPPRQPQCSRCDVNEALLRDLTRQRDQLQLDSSRYERAARDAIELAVHRMDPDTYWQLVAERDALRAALVEAIVWLDGDTFTSAKRTGTPTREDVARLCKILEGE